MIDVRLRTELSGSGPIARRVLDALPSWFGIAESVDHYAAEADRHESVIASVGSDDVGILTLIVHSPYSAEIYVMGIVPEYHRKGIGRDMLMLAEDRLHDRGVEFLQVKTLSPSRPDEGYRRTRRFYEAMGFRPLQEFPDLWGKEQPALQLVKALS